MNDKWIVTECEFVSPIDFGNEPLARISPNHPRAAGLLIEWDSTLNYLVVHNHKKNLRVAVPVGQIKSLMFVEQQPEGRKKARA